MNEHQVRNVSLGGIITSIPVTIAGGQVLEKGAVLSQVKEAGTPAAGAENTGDGTVGSVTLGPKAKIGTYLLVANKATGGGEFNVISPAGHSCGVAVTGKDFISGEINLKLTAGDAAFVLGDRFTIEVTGTGSYCLVSKDAEDGSGTAEAVLMLDVDASEAAKESKAWTSGLFDAALLSAAEAESIDAYREELRMRGIILVNTVGGNY